MFAILFYIKPVEVLAIPSDQNIAMIKSWALPMPSNQNGGFSITSSFSGNDIYYAESGSNTIGRLDVGSNTITEWNIPTANSLPNSITNHPSGDVYFIEINSNTIGRLVPQTNTITEWAIQSNSSDSSAGNNSATSDNIRQFNSLNVDPSNGDVYFIESNSNTIGRLTPFSSEFTEWKFQEKPSTIDIDSAGSVHYIDANGSKIVRMD